MLEKKTVFSRNAIQEIGKETLEARILTAMKELESQGTGGLVFWEILSVQIISEDGRNEVFFTFNLKPQDINNLDEDVFNPESGLLDINRYLIRASTFDNETIEENCLSICGLIFEDVVYNLEFMPTLLSGNTYYRVKVVFK